MRKECVPLAGILFNIHIGLLKKWASLRTRTLPIRILIGILVHITRRRDGGIGM